MNTKRSFNIFHTFQIKVYFFRQRSHHHEFNKIRSTIFSIVRSNFPLENLYVNRKICFLQSPNSMTLVKIQFDESSLCGRFTEVDKRLDQHEEWILELQKMMKNFPSRDEFDSLKSETNDKIRILENKISDLQKKYDNMILDNNRFKDEIDSKMNDLSNFLTSKINQKFNELLGMIPKETLQVINYDDRFKEVEDLISQNKENINSTKSSVQCIASAIAKLIDKDASLDESLKETMNDSIDYVKDNFKKIFDKIGELKDQNDSILSLVNSLSPNKSQASSPRVPIVSPRKSTKSVQSSFSSLSTLQEPRQEKGSVVVNISKTKLGKQSYAYPDKKANDFDLTLIRPYPPIKVSWQDIPDLPKISHFLKIEDFLDYIYKVQPPLQAYLKAMHKKLVQNSEDLAAKLDKDDFQKTLSRLQSIIGEIRNNIDNLRKSIQNTATRDEINDIFEELMDAKNSRHTAIGGVKCLACGREVPKVTGAMSEAELARALGNPPNSIVHKANGSKFGVTYLSKDGFDSEIIETPRSIRTYKQSRPRSPYS